MSMYNRYYKPPTIGRWFHRLVTDTRIELGHWLLGHLEEHRFPHGAISYKGPFEAFKAIRAEIEQIRLNGYKGPKEALEWEPIKLSLKRWRKDAQLFL